jgi:hypothetical protein
MGTSFQLEDIPMAIQIKSFFQLALLSIAGLLFYYSNILLGNLGSPFVYKGIAVLFLMITLPLPIVALHRKDLFKGLQKSLYQLIVLGSVALLIHHFLLTFIIVMFTGQPIGT